MDILYTLKYFFVAPGYSEYLRLCLPQIIVTKTTSLTWICECNCNDALDCNTLVQWCVIFCVHRLIMAYSFIDTRVKSPPFLVNVSVTRRLLHSPVIKVQQHCQNGQYLNPYSFANHVVKCMSTLVANTKKFVVKFNLSALYYRQLHKCNVCKIVKQSL